MTRRPWTGRELFYLLVIALGVIALYWMGAQR